MVAVLSRTILDSAGTRQAWGWPDGPVRETQPPTPVASQYRDPSEDARYAASPFLAPFVAQVLAQFDAATPTDPQEAAAAYRRTTEVHFAPIDILPPI